MNVFAYGYRYTCEPLLEPVMDVCAARGWQVHYQNDHYKEGSGATWPEFAAMEGPRALLVAADLDCGAHKQGTGAVKLARRNNIPSVSIQHGILGGPHQPQFGSVADVACLWGRYVSLNAKSIAYTGNPALDNPPTRDQARERVGRKRYILFAASVRGAEYVFTSEALLHRAVREAAITHDVILRPHPAEYGPKFIQVYERWAAQSERVHVWPGDDEAGLLDLIVGAEAVVGNSSVLLMAAVLGIPAVHIAVQPSPHNAGQLLTSWNGTGTLLPPTTGRMIPDPAFVKHYNTVSPGLASDRIADVLENAALSHHIRSTGGQAYAAV